MIYPHYPINSMTSYACLSHSRQFQLHFDQKLLKAISNVFSPFHFSSWTHRRHSILHFFIDLPAIVPTWIQLSVFVRVWVFVQFTEIGPHLSGIRTGTEFPRGWVVVEVLPK
ncbi:hypothetical protein ACOME3_002170 [Neoechinorhynchus agilis]